MYLNFLKYNIFLIVLIRRYFYEFYNFCKNKYVKDEIFMLKIFVYTSHTNDN